MDQYDLVVGLTQALRALPFFVVPLLTVLYGTQALLRGALDRVLFAAVGALVTCVAPVVILLAWFLVAPSLEGAGEYEGRGLDLSGIDFPLAVLTNAVLGAVAVLLVVVLDIWAQKSRGRV
ncbi:hypothetical protein [Corynebacterium dentalis]|uniref:hypothetical protein n=1 Tax=Corynebacterium dentalis TaxID=2014528 RepID=UPI0028A0C7ED|nr:hypothetical protein [Corynebacterium dentalis]